MSNDRDTHFSGFAELLASEIEALDDLTVPGTDRLSLSYGHWKERVRQIITRRAYDLMQSGCIAINNAQMQQGIRLHPNAMLRAVQDLTQWPESPTPPPDARVEQAPSDDQLL